MLNFGRKNTEEETKQDKKRELECEEAIIAEKNRFGRVRKPFMEYMREEYGSDIADRVHRRINKRILKGYFKQKNGVVKKPINSGISETLGKNDFSVY